MDDYEGGGVSKFGQLNINILRKHSTNWLFSIKLSTGGSKSLE